MKRFVLTRRAKADVEGIWEYIAADDIDAANRIVEALEAAMANLGKNPGIGHWREDLADRNFRFLLVSPYLIVYLEKSKPLRIARVLHASRDVRSMLRLECLGQ
jgi:hypothetical protein